MPYKSWENIGVKEEIIKDWAKGLHPNTAVIYVHYLKHFKDWFKEKGYWQTVEEILNEAKNTPYEDRRKHLNVIVDFLTTLDTGNNNKKTALYAIKNFFTENDVELPKLKNSDKQRIYRPTEEDMKRNMVNRQQRFELEDARKIIIHADQPYKTALLVILQSAMGGAEYERFNKYGYKQVLNHLDDPEPTRIDLVRDKASRTDVQGYFTFLGRDAKQMIKDYYHNLRPETNVDALLVTFNKAKDEYVPLSKRQVADKLRKYAKELGLIKPNGTNRYHITLHEFRDLFKSLCTPKEDENGELPYERVDWLVSEYLLGHKVDPLGYEKSPEYNPEYYRREYKKLEPVLNVISNPRPEDVRRAVNEIKNDLRAENERLKEEIERLKTEGVKEAKELRKQNESMQQQINQIMKDLEEMKMKQEKEKKQESS